MEKETIYIKMEDNVETDKNDILIKDIGKIYCKNDTVVNKCESLKISTFEENGKTRKVISVMKVIQQIADEFPECQVLNIGETDTIIERIRIPKGEKWKRIGKILFVSAVSFFGTAFTIMAFHNDIDIIGIFQQISQLITGKATNGFGVLEISYSIGLGVGIIVFFNHIGGRRITKDPTPIEVEMAIYEKDVNSALIKTADREGVEIDV